MSLAEAALRAGEWPGQGRSLSLQGHQDPLEEQASPGPYRCLHLHLLPCTPPPPGSRTGLGETLSLAGLEEMLLPN